MNRKSVSLSVDKDGTPVIKAPYSASDEFIENFYNSRIDWVRGKQRERASTESKRREVFSSDVDVLPLFGREYTVTHEKKQYGFDWNTFNLPSESFGELRSYIISMYRKIAAADIPRRVAKYAPLVGVTPSAVKITSASSRWGSCSGKGSLNFSWKLVVAPEDVIDYVVVHELCHMIHMDHSPLFWAEVERIVPDWRSKRDELKNVQRIIAEKALE